MKEKGHLKILIREKKKRKKDKLKISGKTPNVNRATSKSMSGHKGAHMQKEIRGKENNTNTVHYKTHSQN